MRDIGDYILLYNETKEVSTSLGNTIGGCLRDRQTQEAIPSCYVVLEGGGLGTVTNLEGKFILKIPDSLSSCPIVVSHIGYRSRTLSQEVFVGGNPDIYLDPVFIQLQEVVVRYVPAQKIVREMIDNLSKNYSNDPVFFTSFYREGAEYGGAFLSLSEGVCQIYKRGLNSMGSDQVKLLKMRNIDNPNFGDSILVKIQAGIRASLLLDIVQALPDFLSSNRENDYLFMRAGMKYDDLRMAHIVAFEQKPGVEEPLFSGRLYIDAQHWTLLMAEYEINPKFVKEVGPNYVIRKSKNTEVEPQKIAYSVTYRQWNDFYYVSHVRGDLQFKIKRKKSLFWSSRTLSAFFEMVTCDIDDRDVHRFPNRERLPTTQIFSQTSFEYDADFWERFNTIVPETKITDAISKLLLNVKESREE